MHGTLTVDRDVLDVQSGKTLKKKEVNDVVVKRLLKSAGYSDWEDRDNK
jgi:hypothetical protein